MSSSSLSAPAGTLGHLATPEYKNWLSLGHALTTVLCQGLRTFINREVQSFYNNIIATMAAIPAGPCACTHVPRRKPNPYHDMRVCAWANVLQGHHRGYKTNWKGSDSSKWTDPNLGPWEIAKLYLPDSGGHGLISGAEDMDISGILNLMYWCDHFAVQQPLIKDVRDVRNTKWGHVTNPELSDADKKDAFDKIEKLLQDPQLIHEVEAQKALKELVNLKCVSDLHSVEARVLAYYRKVVHEDISDIKNELEEERRSKKQRNKLAVLAVAILVLVLLFSTFRNILDDSSENDAYGCSMKKYGDPLKLKYFDFSDFINSSSTGFVGRQWLNHKIQNIFYDQKNVRGVLLIGNPGSGKSAFVSNLICPRSGIPFIHDRILGYHFCMHSDKGTQDGAKFVRNLANMIAWEISEYRDIIISDPFVHRVLHNDCPQDPGWCFEQGILVPLKKLATPLKTSWYVIIDALDECSGDKADILNILKSKIQRLPAWFKLILTSRNISSIATSLVGVRRVELRSDDERNLKDIDTYLSLRVLSLQDSILHRIKTALSITDNNATSQKLISSLAEKAQGNFLFIQVALDFWLSSTESVSWENFPRSLDTTFQLYFEQKYGSPATFQSLREIFEVLVAAFTPLSIQEIHSILQLDHPTLDLEYDLMPKLDEVSLFLWHGSEKGLLRIYHASLSEWLTSDANKGRLYYVKKRDGHKRLAKYHLKTAQQKHIIFSPEEAFHLASHIVEGGSNKSHKYEFLSLPSSQVNGTDPVTRFTALHIMIDSATANSGVTELLAQHFSSVDPLDNDQRTPAFIAASEGHLDSLIVLFKRGANLNHTVTYLDTELASHSKDLVYECKRKLCEYSLLHTAAQKGHVHVVDFLIEHQVDIFKTTGANNTAVQLAAENGHLETVKRLRKAGGTLDGVSLHHAAAGGHKHVVQYLLREGVEDACVHSIPLPMTSDQTENEGHDAVKIHVYDNHHLYLRETALHAAVRHGHLSVIESLLSYDENAIDCTNALGRRPLHEAAYRNRYNALETMLAVGANASLQSGKAGSRSSGQLPSLVLDELSRNNCPCGFTPLHTAAMRGHYSVAKLLIAFKSDVDAMDCNGSTPLHVAACQGHLSILSLLVKSGANVSAKSFNGSTPLHSAAACFAKTSFRPLLGLGCDYLATDSGGMTALHYTVKDVDVVGYEYFVDLYVSEPKNWIEAGTAQKQAILNDEYPWLNALIGLIESVAETKTKEKSDLLAIKDKENLTIFDKLEEKSNASSLLTGSNKFGETLLVLSATPFTFAYDFTIQEIIKSGVKVLNKQYETSLIPSAITAVLSKALISVSKYWNCSSLVERVSLNLVLAVNVMLQAGLDVNCQDHRGFSPILVYLNTGGRHMSKVLVKHGVRVDISCGDAFENSTLHLVSYHKLHYLHYLSQFLLGDKNWQLYLQSDNAIFDYFFDAFGEVDLGGNDRKTIRTGNGPLAIAIMSHPKGVKIIDECFDADGYNAFHRAAQGANLIAIQRFLSWGANPTLKTKNGLPPLLISVLYAVKYRPFLNLDQPNMLTALEVELASMSSSAILNHLLQNGTIDVGCNKSHSGLTLYHIAATRGMWQFIAHLLSEENVTGIDVDCATKEGITPMYLATLIGGNACKWHSPWCKVVDIIKTHGGQLRYPTLEAEYFLIFNIYFGMNPSKLFLDLTEQEILTLQEDCGRHECSGYRTGHADLLRSSNELDRVYSEYNKKVDKCSRYEEGCPADVKESKVRFILATDLRLHFFYVRNSFVGFLDKQIQRMKELLVNATRPYEGMSCSNAKGDHDKKSHSDTIDICSAFGKQNLETELLEFYRIYKVSYDFIAGDTELAKILLTSKGKPPRSLAEMFSALHNYDTTLSCDWQAIATKYVQLSFQVRNLNFWYQAVQETSTVPTISDFLSSRMENAILKPSKESLRLVLKLASGQPSETFDYLKILRFTKPPMWGDTFSGLGNFG